MLVLLVGTGIFLSFRLRFLPQKKLFYGIRMAFSRNGGGGDISPFAALMTSLAATIGTGNIVGVATAFAMGGPGAVLWMWVTALVGLSTKYTECLLAVKYRIKGMDGQMRGGPMYTMENGIKNKRLGRLLGLVFSACAVLASFGIGNLTQANAVSGAAAAAFGLSPVIAGIVMAACAFVVMLGGIKSIARICGRLVPFMGAFYILGGLVVIALHIDRLGSGLTQIFSAAFSGQAAAGGFAGATVASALRFGVARGVFSNEAGLGSAPIAAASAKTDHPARQGLVSMTGTFFDTLVVCTITALVIACTGMWQEPGLSGASMTLAAFEAGLPGIGRYIVTIGLMLFAFSSILGWAFYGERSLEYIAGSQRATGIYRFVFCCAVFVGAVVPLKLVWGFSDIANALMAVPNLICLLCLSGVAARETRDFWRNKKV